MRATSLRASGFDVTTTGDTLCAEHDKDSAREHSFPRTRHLSSHRAQDQSRPGQDGRGAGKACRAKIRPSRRTPTKKPGQTIISGMGELHLEIILDRLYREFKVEANHGKPQVSYKEAITKPSHAEGRYVKQTGGHGQYGHCIIRCGAGGVRRRLRICKQDIGRRRPEGVYPCD